jgi:predicted GIY-YIG superfamily endonuclease
LTNRPNGILYVGVTNNLIRRAYEHRSGFVDGFTKRYGFKRLVYFETFDDIRAAIQREHNIKHWPRAWSKNNNGCESRLGRSLRDDRTVKTWMAGTSPAMTE